MKKAAIIISAAILLGAGYSFAAFWNNAKKDVQRHTTDVRASAQAAWRAERGKGFKEGYAQYKAIQPSRQLDPVSHKEVEGTSAREQWKLRQKAEKRLKKSGSF